MIERISGRVIEKNPTFCIIENSGLGIGVFISLNTFQKIEQHSSQENVTLYTYLHVREDALQLYGFGDEAEKRMFQLLISISGVGPRLAIAILSGSTPAELEAAIAREDVGMLTRIPGVGKKTAQRLILELKEKIQEQTQIDQITSAVSVPAAHQTKVTEAVLALVALGYKQPDAQKAINKAVARLGADASLEVLIKEALKEV
ncbi:MAG: Holliday junction branch migration protein RuvA [Calditrichaeota bacterium]|nr:MAG: Holliday junction branch migration protein RuvA [Calditrichota bacterium]